MSRQEQWWSGAGGDDYTARNRVVWAHRVPFWDRVLPKDLKGSVLEIGTNAGWNGYAILKARPSVEYVGVDVNDLALNQAQAGGLEVAHVSASRIFQHFGPKSFDYVISTGVLIHVPPAELLIVMSAMRKVAAKGIIVAEYESLMPEAIEYRGETGLLWKRPYGELFKAIGCHVISEGNAEGFDRCHYWMMAP
jgi:SAM-dependent methyltransferase